MNELIWIDFIILGIVSISALVSFFRGFVREAIALTGGLGLEIFGFNLDLAVGASPKTEEVEAVNDQTIPSRLNASVMISYRQEF